MSLVDLLNSLLWAGRNGLPPTLDTSHFRCSYHLHSSSDSIFNVCYSCFCKLLCSAKISCNHVVRSVFQGSSLSCRNSIGYNFKYGSNFVCDYSSGNLSVVNLIREIRDNSLFVYDFDQNMLNMIVYTVSCE